MKEEEIVALLGRPLTSVETTNLDLYLKIAKERLEDLLCMNLKKETAERTFNVRSGYSTVFTDMFSQVNSVSIDGVEIDTDDYTPYQWNRQNADWFNSIVLDYRRYRDTTVVIDASWGVCAPMVRLLWAQLFALIGSMAGGNGNVKSKRVEDFSITFNENTVHQQFLIDNEATIAKYSICGISNIKSGDVCRPRHIL